MPNESAQSGNSKTNDTSSNKTRISLKITSGKQKQIESAIALIKEQYGTILDIWNTLPEEKKRSILDHSPLLNTLLKNLI